MSGPTIVFDLDGALIETAPDLVATPNIILTREGLSPRAYEAARNLIGGGAKANDCLKPKGASVRRHSSKNCLRISSRIAARTSRNTITLCQE
jgi:hypothetical protein